MKYADIIIDNKADSTDMPYTYGAEASLALAVGDKVYVPFARSRTLREGYVMELKDTPGEDFQGRMRMVDHRDEIVSLTPEIMRTARWMRDRYVCRCIDALHCFTPPGKRRSRQAAQDPEGPPAEKEPSRSEGSLTAEQQAAAEAICTAIRSGVHDRFLLQGVTGSGKTEVYIRSVRETLDQGRNAIVLVPEISLTPQITERFTAVFGEEQIVVLHSKLSMGERFARWEKIRSGQVHIVIGARSAVFAPFEHLGLIVIDEEHEATYKSDATPKYDTIEVAMKRLGDRDNQGVLLLGSATPSVVNFSRAREGIYRTLRMQARYNQASLPEVSIADMREELRAGNRSMISRRLKQEMDRQLEAGRQIMLLLNRRGHSTFISCRECGYVASCPICGLSLTYHSAGDILSCHYCGHEEKKPVSCPSCGSRYIRYFGSGTEKAEETIRELLPDYTVDRIDLDSVRRKGELRRRLKAFGRGKTQILIGTQMIAKGLDFHNVGLVGILSADLSLNIPDFRSPERSFQLITQAAGRAGRGEHEGKVIIQTYNPDHYAIRHAANQDFDGFFQEELAFRSYMCYPPFSDIIQVLFTAGDQETAREGAQRWYEYLTEHLDAGERSNVFQPQRAYLEKIRETYRYSLVIRCPRGSRKLYTSHLRNLKELDAKQRVKYIAVVDINPYSFA